MSQISQAEISQADPIPGSWVYTTSADHRYWPRITFEAIRGQGYPMLRITSDPGANSDDVPQVIALESARLRPIVASLRDFAENGRFVKNPPPPSVPIRIIGSAHGLTVRFMRNEYFLLQGADLFEASKSQWRVRGYQVKEKDVRPSQKIRLWTGRNWNEYEVYRIEDTREIQGRGAHARRADFQLTVRYFVGLKNNIVKQSVRPPMGWPLDD